ncbi:unnamed protein product [Adineta steineri]|nr:unnamed protein product [Adineta steineri]
MINSKLLHASSTMMSVHNSIISLPLSPIHYQSSVKHRMEHKITNGPMKSPQQTQNYAKASALAVAKNDSSKALPSTSIAKRTPVLE